jgi:hypothetical protein
VLSKASYWEQCRRQRLADYEDLQVRRGLVFFGGWAGGGGGALELGHAVRLEAHGGQAVLLLCSRATRACLTLGVQPLMLLTPAIVQLSTGQAVV